MSKKIPDAELVKRVIYHTLRRVGVVHTQEELAQLVEAELKKLDKKYAISPQRVRRIALEIENLEVTVKTKRSKKEKPRTCPVCGEQLKPLYAKNLVGEKVAVGFKCPKCGYHGDDELFAPMQYEFKLLKK